ncbi:hypothetical protein SAMN06265337_0925 [Hymenobacter gelipurpurascens]|uniref:Uncharacterized protein n=2 Tax=Hymenobacter gelipurpurascens TaxID=89968 RepID=A0A212TCV5_9BACT|nr:hypothetical protein SAMN06265337_0925 [Hymenobacter gelipurpurascens]
MFVAFGRKVHFSFSLMLSTEASFRSALNRGQLNTAAILLAQLLVEYYEQHKHLGLAQEVYLQRQCEQLLAQRTDWSADALLQAAQQYVPA